LSGTLREAGDEARLAGKRATLEAALVFARSRAGGSPRGTALRG